jgi:hypothetical protein
VDPGSEVWEDFATFLSQAAGSHALAVTGLSQIANTFETLPATADNPDPTIHWGAGDPNFLENSPVYRGWKRSDALAYLRPGGTAVVFQGWSWIALVYGRWEDDYRHRFAKAMGCGPKEVRSDVFGDLRHLRNDVTHKKGIASREESGKCQVLTAWYEIGQPIVIGVEHVSAFYKHLQEPDAVYQAQLEQPR